MKRHTATLDTTRVDATAAPRPASNASVTQVVARAFRAHDEASRRLVLDDEALAARGTSRDAVRSRLLDIVTARV